MSNWTHVVGTIRIDCLRGLYEYEDKPNFDEIFGKECRWIDDNSIWNDAEENPQNFLPMGSEGSLHKIVWENPDKSHIQSYMVTVFGDLRDHDEPDDIIKWFKEICSKLWVRNAVIEVTNEWYGTKVYSYNSEEAKGE